MGQPNLNQMMKQVQKMQADMAKAQEELKNEVVEASAGGGMVTVKISGELEQGAEDRPRRRGPRGRRDAPGHGPGRGERGDPGRSGAGRLEDERSSGGLAGPGGWARWASPASERPLGQPLRG